MHTRRPAEGREAKANFFAARKESPCGELSTFDVCETVRHAIHSVSLDTLFLTVYSVAREKSSHGTRTKIRSVPGGRVIRFQIDKRRPIETIKPAHLQCPALDRHQFHEGRSDGVRPDRRTQGKCSGRPPRPERCLQHEIAARAMHPV